MGNAFTTTLATASAETLTAVNDMIKLCGLREVAALDTGNASQAGDAERILDDVRDEILSRGWHQNTEYDVEYTPASSDAEIDLGSAILAIDSWVGRSNGHPGAKNVVKRGSRLYDIDENSFAFTTISSLKTRIIRRLDMSYLTIPLQRHISGEAAVRLYRMHVKGRGMNRQAAWLDLENSIIGEARLRRAEAYRDNQEHSDWNILNSEHSRNVRGRRVRYVSGIQSTTI